MQHLEEGTIHAWLDGALPAEEAARVERHAAECPECAALIAEARGLVAGASRILSALDDVPAVVPGVGRGAPSWETAPRSLRPSAPARRALWSRPGVLAAAASVVLMVGTAVVVTKTDPAPRVVEMAAPAAARTTESSADTTTTAAGTAAAPAPASPGAEAPGETAATRSSRRSTGGAGGAAIGAPGRRDERNEGRVVDRAAERRSVARALPDSAVVAFEAQASAAPRALTPSPTAQRGAPTVSNKAMPIPAPPPGAARLESAVVTPRADSSPVAAAAARAPTDPTVRSRRAGVARAQAQESMPTAPEVRTDSVVAQTRVDTVAVEPTAPPSYRPLGRARATARPFPVTGCYEVLEGGLPRHITLKTNSVWSGAAEHAFVATAERAIGYWSQPRTGAVHLVIAGAVVTARVDAATGELRGTAQWGRKKVPFVARRGCK